jgi:hypothetical protein
LLLVAFCPIHYHIVLLAMTTYQVFVSTTPGLEAYLEHEMRSILGATHSITRVVGGVELGFIDMHRIHQLLWCSSIAERIKLRIGSPFNCPTFDVLEQRLTQLPLLSYFDTQRSWQRQSMPDRATPTLLVDAPQFRVSVDTGQGSQLYHSGTLEQRNSSSSRRRRRRISTLTVTIRNATNALEGTRLIAI